MLTQDNIEDRQVISTRIFGVSPGIMFKAWSAPELLSQWWGPEGFTNTFNVFDFREGGEWDFVMHGPGGTHYKNNSAFVRIIPNKQIVINHLSHPHFRLTATFEDVGGKTKLIFAMLFELAEVLAKMKHIIIPANEENFDRLETVLSKI